MENLSAVLLAGAGLVGLITAAIHGVVMQRYMVGPLIGLAKGDRRIRSATVRLVAPILHVSTLAWLLIGALLIWAALRLEGEPRLVISASGLLIYGHAAIANLTAVRGFHPGWVLMAISCALIVAAVSIR